MSGPLNVRSPAGSATDGARHSQQHRAERRTTSPGRQGAAEHVRIRPVGDGLAFASLVCDGWSIAGIRVRASDGGFRIEWPSTESRDTRYPVVAPPPALRDALEAQITAAFRRLNLRARP